MSTTCYSREQLEGFLIGQLGDELSGQIELHVADCPNCEDTLAELDGAGDTLIRTLRLKSGAAAEDSPAWIEHVAERQYSGVTAETSCELPSRMGDYELQRVLGRGGMSIVFAARHAHLGRDVALKVLLPKHQQHGISRDRFAREMRAVGALDHPAIVRATDAGQYRNTSYLVMEKIDGVDLTLVAARLGPLSVADACQLTVAVAQGLSYAHQKGVVHRDIKPSNLIIDDQGSVKILDFGLARIQPAVGEVSLQTTVGQLLGTLDYMAPEQADGSDVDARADIYALGATLFKLLAGRPPHGRSAEVPILEHLNRLARNEAPRLAEFRDDLPEPLVELVSSMLRKNPQQRVSSAQEVAERLAEFTAGANLQALRNQAYSSSDDENHEQSAASMRASLDQIWPDLGGFERAIPPQKPLPGDASKRRPPAYWSLIAAGLLGLVATVCFGVVIILQTGDGEIRIESEVDDVHVDVIKDGQRAEALVVAQGMTAIKIRSGKYEIRIDSTSDGVEVTPRQVIVRRFGTAIATIRRTPAAPDTVERASQASQQLAVLDLQIRLAEATSQLAAARQKYGPRSDHPEVKQLAEQVNRLHAVSRPIPNEPVYEGRTLSAWLAQMRFEQQTEAKQYAAQSVVELSGTRPGSEGLKLALEAGGLLVEMRLDDTEDRPLRIDDQLYRILSDQVGPFGAFSNHALDLPVQRLENMDRAEADRILAEQLAGDDSSKRSYAMLLFARMVKRVGAGEGGWTTTRQALHELTRDGDQRTRDQARTILAAGVKDETTAIKYLTEANANEASYLNLLSWSLVTRDRTLAVPGDRQIQWLGEYFRKIPLADAGDREYRNNHVYLHELFTEPTMGPLLGVNWNEATAEQRDVVSKALGHLISELLEESQQLARKPLLEPAVSSKSWTLCHVIDYVSLDEPTRKAALAALNLRLEHLLALRDRSETSIMDSVVDSPSQVAVAITLLSGNTPAAIQQSPTGSGPYSTELQMLSQISAAGRVSLGGPSQGRNRLFDQQFTWYPYQALSKFAELQASLRPATGSRSRRDPGFSAFVRSGRTLVHPVLAVDYIADMAETDESAVRVAAALSGVLAKPRDLAPYVKRHAKFAERIAVWSEKAKADKMIAAPVEILRELWTETQYIERLQEWLTGTDSDHASFAVVRLRQHDPARFRLEWSRDVAQALARLAAERGSFEAMEIHYLHELGDGAEPAVSQLAKFVMSRLESPGELLNRVSLTENHFRPMAQALEVLVRFPAAVRSMKSAIEVTIAREERENPQNTVYREALEDFLKGIE